MLPRGWAALVVVAVLATSARAQVSDEVGIERYRAAIDRNGLADVEWAYVPAHLHWDAGLLVGFAHAPLVIYDRDMAAVDALVERRLSTTLSGAVGLYDRIQVGVSADIVGYQSGVDGSASPTMKSLPTGGLGDLRLLAKAKLSGHAHYQVALLAALSVPGGGGRGFLREAGVTFAPALAISATQGPIRGAVNVGYLLRPAVDTAGLHSDDEGFARAALGYTLGEIRAPAAELFTALSAASPLTGAERNQVAIEMFAGASRRISPTVDAFAGGGIGLDNGFGTPDWRLLAGVRFGAAPSSAPPPVHETAPVIDKDTDGDGVPDSADKCPAAKELVNKFRDDDGCPEAPAKLAGRVVTPSASDTHTPVSAITANTLGGVEPWKEEARARAYKIIERDRRKSLYPNQELIADEIARDFRRDGVHGAGGKPLTGAYIKRHALTSISSAQGKQLSIENSRGK